MKVEKIVVSAYAQICDINQPERGFGYHINFVEKKTYDDGEVTYSTERQVNMEGAKELGLELPEVFSIINAAQEVTLGETRRELDQVKAGLAEVEARATAVQADLSQKLTLLGAAEVHIVGLEETRATMTARITGLEQARDTMTAHIAELEETRATMTAHIAELEAAAVKPETPSE